MTAVQRSGSRPRHRRRRYRDVVDSAASSRLSPAVGRPLRPASANRVIGTDGRRVIFIGLDGADWSLLDDYMPRGTMPTLARLVKEGASGTLTTIHPPLSPLIWTTMLTGVSPLEHRILDFLRVNPVSGSASRSPATNGKSPRSGTWRRRRESGPARSDSGRPIPPRPSTA